MAVVRFVVDGRVLESEEGRNLLETCLENEIYIPNLCHTEGMLNPPASCRLCFVEIEGRSKPVTACNTPVSADLIVRTDSDAARRLQRMGLRLLLSVHKAECKKCPSNRRCPLQKMARFLGVRLRPRRIEHIDRERPRIAGAGLIDHIPERCVLCGKCITVCEQRNPMPLLTFAQRGFDTVIASFVRDGNYSTLDCKLCRACIEVCPVSALILRELPGPDQPR